MTDSSPPRISEAVSAELDEQETAYRLERMSRRELIGRRVRLSDGQTGDVVHVEYTSPERVALVKTFPETPCPLTRVGVDRLSPPHLPYIAALVPSPGSGSPDGSGSPRKAESSPETGSH